MESRCDSPGSTISLGDSSAGHDNSVVTTQTVTSGQLNESVIHEALQTALCDEHLHWLHIQMLDKSTTHQALREIFYHFGAHEAFVVSPRGDSRGKLQGYVSFPHSAMADLAVEKVNTFVPFRQSGPLTVTKVNADRIKKELAESRPEAEQRNNSAICSQLWSALHPTHMESLQLFLSTHQEITDDAIADLMAMSLEATTSVQRINLATLLCAKSPLSRIPRGESIRLAFLSALSQASGHCAANVHQLILGAGLRHTANRPPSASSTQTQQRVHEATLRTAYLSKIPSEMHRSTLLNELGRYGQLLKLRLCSGQCGVTSYAFAEMSTVAAANAVVGRGQILVGGHTLRAQHAKSPIQDANRGDASFLRVQQIQQ